ncbi:MAG: hypothetical protein ACLQVL_00630 [Terriglobia bacterium]
MGACLAHTGRGTNALLHEGGPNSTTVLVGLVASWALTRTMVHWLVGISPSDPVTYLGVTALLLGVALLACGIPALRATRVEPMAALRHE